MTDNECRTLLRDISNGDRDAFSRLYINMEQPVFSFIRSKLNDPFEAGDILHEVFLQVWRSAGTFQGRSTVKTWLFGIAFNKTMDHFRKNSKEMPTDSVPEQEDESICALDLLSAKSNAEQVRRCMDTLSDDHRLTLWLAFFEDMSYPEISSVLNIPEGTVKTRVFHAKQLMKRCLWNLREVLPS